jgi:glycosyltransferase involved in cell wall biosynthesis
MHPATQARRSLRLVLVTETYPPEVNGVARTLGRWAAAFRERGHVVHVIHPRRPGEPPGPDRVHGISLPFYRQVRFGIAGPRKLGRMLARLKPDLVHVATEGPLGFSALLASRAAGVPVASSFHTNFDHYAAHYGFFGIQKLAFAYLRWFHNRTRVTLVPSRATRSRLTADGMQRVEIWSRGVDAQVFHPRYRDAELRRSLGLGEEDVLLVYVGRLAPEKNLKALLLAFAKLRAALPAETRERVKLALVGGGPEQEVMARAAWPGVHLAGERHGQDLARWYASGDVFGFPSLSETFGNVLLEAQASGLPVAAFDCEGPNERVTPEIDGLLVPAGGDLMPALLRLCQDRELRKRFGAAARAKAEAQDWRPIFDELEGRYVDLVERSGPSPPGPLSHNGERGRKSSDSPSLGEGAGG